MKDQAHQGKSYIVAGCRRWVPPPRRASGISYRACEWVCTCVRLLFGVTTAELSHVRKRSGVPKFGKKRNKQNTLRELTIKLLTYRSAALLNGS